MRRDQKAPIALSAQCRQDNVPGMTASSIILGQPHRSRKRLHALALAAMLALFSMFVLSMWHDALPHIHAGSRIVTMAEADHDHAPAGPSDPADVMHLTVHTIIHAVDLPAAPDFALMAPIASVWGILPSVAVARIAPSSILRPPRS